MKILVISNNLERASFRQRIGIYIDTFQKVGINCDVEMLPSTERARLKIFKSAADYDGVFFKKDA